MAPLRRSKTAAHSASMELAAHCSRRVRRKCSFPHCPNRVVQGGVCVTHGAKRKMCCHPHCDKAVKLAGYCSTHGPARRKCDTPTCTRVAVQGGRCLSHGAKRRVCQFSGDGGCNKNAIVAGMCKKHYDLTRDANEGLERLSTCVEIASHADSVPAEVSMDGSTRAVPFATLLNGNENPPVGHYHIPTPSPPAQVISIPQPSYKKNSQPTHKRGLSIFEDMTTVNAIINSGADNQQPAVVTSAPIIVANKQLIQQASPPVTILSATQESNSAKPSTDLPIPSVPMIPTRTPAPQVSFADSSNCQASNAASSGNASTLPSKPFKEDYYSPTIAIFEQMIKASEVIDEKTSINKLTPRGKRQVSFWSGSGNLTSGVVNRKVLGYYDGQKEGYLMNTSSGAHVVGVTRTVEDLHRTVSQDDEQHLSHPPPYSYQQYVNFNSFPSGNAHPHSRTTSPTNVQLTCTTSAPETPDLTSNSYPPLNIVSAGSQNGYIPEERVNSGPSSMAFLPKMRSNEFEHLFIPSALS